MHHVHLPAGLPDSPNRTSCAAVQDVFFLEFERNRQPEERGIAHLGIYTEIPRGAASNKAKVEAGPSANWGVPAMFVFVPVYAGSKARPGIQVELFVHIDVVVGKRAKVQVAP